MRRIDLATLAGLGCALGFVLYGHRIGGGSLTALLQPTAALVVFGGTLGALLIAHPFHEVRRALRAVRRLFSEPVRDDGALLDEIVQLAQVARRDGIVALEEPVQRVADPFFRRAFLMVIDGLDPKAVSQALERELEELDEHGELPARIFESAGGTAPTLGIVGAVLGLIHVLASLSDVGRIGSGIAVAFVATLYGVGAANLLFFPAATKLRALHRRDMLRSELIARGALAIQQGESPRSLADTLAVFAPGRTGPDAGRARAKAA